MHKSALSGIYAILPADIDTPMLLSYAEQALKGGVKTLQFRDKKHGFKRAIKRARALRDLTRNYDARLIINDSVQLASAADADGVHLGRDDAPNLIQLREEIGDSMMVGITCRADAAFAKSVLADGADYVSFGAVWASSSKPEVPELGIPRLIKARQLFPEATICAIGGIDRSNLVQVKAAGVDAAAVISGLFAADDIEAEASLLCQLWDQA